MPLFDYLCLDCGNTTEILVSGSDTVPSCAGCGSANVKRMLSAPSPLSGASRSVLPGPGDTPCCGHGPAEARCAGPGSCCGKTG